MKVYEPYNHCVRHFHFVLDAPLEPGSPQILSDDFQDSEVVAGSELKLECRFSGSPQPDVEWFKDGGPLLESDRIKCTVNDDVARLVIKKHRGR